MRKKWEYTTRTGVEVERLNLLGEKGWECVNFASDTYNSRTYLFKREKEDKKRDKGYKL